MSNDKQDQILAQIVNLIGLSAEAQAKATDAIRSQNAAIDHIPSRRDLFGATTILLIMVLLTVLASTWLTYSQQQDSQRVGEQNRLTVQVYCAAAPDLTECTIPGSDTAKASAILANCRIFANLIVASTAPEQISKLPSSPGCAALKF